MNVNQRNQRKTAKTENNIPKNSCETLCLRFSSSNSVLHDDRPRYKESTKLINKNGEKVDELQGASEDQLRAKIAALKK